MRIKTILKGGRISLNHNQQIRRDGSKARGLKVRTNVKAGRIAYNQRVAGGLRVKSKLRAGGVRLQNHNQTFLAA